MVVALLTFGVICRGVSVFAISSFRSFGFHDEARLSGRTENVLISDWSACLGSDQIRLGKGWG